MKKFRIYSFHQNGGATHWLTVTAKDAEGALRRWARNDRCVQRTDGTFRRPILMPCEGQSYFICDSEPGGSDIRNAGLFRYTEQTKTARIFTEVRP